jgi:hypothetical protein
MGETGVTQPKKRGGRREGAGRPKLMNDAQSFGLWLDSPMLADLDALATRLKKTRPEVIREAVAAWIKRNNTGRKK